ncbi:hypothetical protein BOTCAL_0013g00470 [Botryotinia calthae]|uniref:Methyltransferase type 11 domain-containing protein n=1 Tax=Botryotinia calthae TaxID=38488 RepID=A0A4Y8DI77_9HELO|nr:hypothetical protein BOTCAL_0013g00470 [Botryotinia calthae]
MSTSENPLWNDPKIVKDYRCVERIIRPAGELLIEQTNILGNWEGKLVVFDNACGTEAISRILCEKLDEAQKANLELTCGDLTTGMIEHMEHVITAEKWTGAKAKIIDARKTGLPDNFYTHVIMNLGFQTMPHTLKALQECVRILRPNGIFASTTWENLGWIEVMQDATATISGAPKYPQRAAIMKFLSDGAWEDRSWVIETLEKQGLMEVKAVVHPMLMKWNKVQEFMDSTFPIMMSMFPLNLWTQGDREKYGPLLVPALEAFLVEKYGKDSPFDLKMIAITATATKTSED